MKRSSAEAGLLLWVPDLASSNPGCYNGAVRAIEPTAIQAMPATTRLSIREENELCVSIASELCDYLQSGEVSHQLIRETLRNQVAIYGVGHTDDFFIDTVIRSIGERLTP